MASPHRSATYLVLSGCLFFFVVAHHALAQTPIEDRTLVLRYTFDQDGGEVARDLSTYHNDGKITKGRYLAELDGRTGIVRLEGEGSSIQCPDSDSLFFGGDMSFEMRARLNGPPKASWCTLFGNGSGNFALFLVWWHSIVLHYSTLNEYLKMQESMVLPVDRSILTTDWSHIAVVVEYPRCRFYCNGVLVRDAYMPFPGIGTRSRVPLWIGHDTPLDLDEFRFYRRALTEAEVAAHARGEEMAPPEELDLAVEPHWYEDRLEVRLSAKGAKFGGYRAEMTLLEGNYDRFAAPQTVPLKEAFAGCGRYVGTASFALEGLQGKSLDAVARILDPTGKTVRTAFSHAWLKKPDWVHTQEGYSEDVPPPWTPVEATRRQDGGVELRVWGRRHLFSPSGPLPQEIETTGASMLASPVSLVGRTDGKKISWKNGRIAVTDNRPTSATVDQNFDSETLSLDLSARIEYDGYILFDCAVRARQQTSVEVLALEVPLVTRHAILCQGRYVYPEDPKVPMKTSYSGAVGAERHFRFSPCIWIGDDERGMCWQTESDEHWHYADEQDAIEIVPSGEVTMFRAHFVNVPTALAAGEALRYRFAILATPVKPLLRDAWDLRIARSEPYGGDLDLPDRVTGGVPTLQQLSDLGVRHLFTNVNDIWPYPLPVHDRFARALHRLIDEAHAWGIRPYPYLIHERYPVAAPEFDINGLHMSRRPVHQYIPGGNPPGSERPGPVTAKYGADSQGTVDFCSQSLALQDAVVHSLARRLDEYGDDGVYLDGTGWIEPPCYNTLHGCGYRGKDGSIHPTYRTFAERELMKRIYLVVKKRRPMGIIDVHHSFGQNPAALAYADVLWTGEHWWHLRETGAKDGYISAELPLDMFRAEFTGRQIGIAAETLAYRLGPQMKVAAISLLHDIPVRPSTTGLDQMQKDFARGMDPFAVMVRIWRLRERFGAREAEKLYYWHNQDFVRVSPEKCYATLFKHPRNGVLAFVSNLRPDAQTVTVEFNLDRLGLSGRQVEALDGLSDQAIPFAAGKISVPLDSENWLYIWLRPR